jgi:serine/threonine protein kinase
MVAVANPRYEVVCRLAGGGMADLYLARVVGMAGFERLVVIKRLAKSLASNPAAMQALFDEARIAATLSHANIVQVNDVEVVDGEVSIVMEFLHGHDVAHLLRRLRTANHLPPLDQAVAITQCVCAGLHHAHERVGPDGQSLKIVHRDVSPHNVFVTYDGTVKLVDFGIARATTRRGHTEHGVIKGKPGYIAPEQLYGRPVDRRTDVWGTGVLLFEMTTGSPPFGDSPGIDKMVAVATKDPPTPSSLVATYPPELEAIVMRAIARDPNQRYDSCEAMRLDLDAFARARGLDLSPFRIGALMERVFAPQLAAWRNAQREGLSLSDHVAAFRHSRPMEAVDLAELGEEPDTDPSDPPVSPPPIQAVDVRAATEVASTAPSPAAAVHEPAPSPGLSRRWRVVIGIVATPLLLLAGIGIWSVIDARSRPGAALAAPAPQTAPVATPQPIVQPIEAPKPAVEPAKVEPKPPAKLDEPKPPAKVDEPKPPAKVDEPAPEPAKVEDTVPDPAIEIETPKQAKPVKKRPVPARVVKTASPPVHPPAPLPPPTRPATPPVTTTTPPPAAPPAPPDPDAPLPR